MRAWQAARIESRATASQVAPNSSRSEDPEKQMIREWLKSIAGRYEFNKEPRKCFYCLAVGKLTTGFVPTVGAIWKCKGCKAKHEEVLAALR